MSEHIQLLTHNKFPIFMREFGEGALLAAKDRGITVIIDVFRASNTILALFEYTDKIKPVLSVEEAKMMHGYVKVGEDSRDFTKFDYDNSPTNIIKNPEKFKDKSVVVRTTNGTRGLINAVGSKLIIVGSFRNFTAVINLCHKFILQGDKVSFVAMGSKTISRIEDTHCAKMMFYSLAKKLGDYDLFESIDNPHNRDWLSEIKKKRPFVGSDYEDRVYSTTMDQTDKIPIYNQKTKFLEIS